MTEIIAPPKVDLDPLPGTVMLCYRGSVAHGMWTPPEDPNSIDDVDLMGFVVGEAKHYFGLGADWQAAVGSHSYWEGHYDCVYYEIRKAVSLLIKGNPNILSVLWTRPEHRIVESEFMHDLRLLRSGFIGKHVYSSFAGYANSQLVKMESREPAEMREYLAVTAELKHRGIHPNHKGERVPITEELRGEAADVRAWSEDKLLKRMLYFHKKGSNLGYMGDKRKQLVLEHGYDTKNAAHLIRLLRMAKEFMVTGELEVYRHDAEELLDIKKGKWKLSDVKKLADELFAECTVARDKSPLPDGPDVGVIEEFLVETLASKFSFSRVAARYFGAARRM